VLLFVGSGFAALVYEVVWFQVLQIVIGSSATSLGVLLGTFMGGMCLGSLLLPRAIGPRHHPLRVYAGLELAIGAFALLLLMAVPLVDELYALGGGRVVLRVAIAAVCLLPPTMAMGATLPAIARAVEPSRTGVAWLGWFYAGNLAGAVAGALVAGFYLLRVHDVVVATVMAAAVNVAVAAAAWVMAAKTVRLKADPTTEFARPSPKADPTADSAAPSGTPDVISAPGARLIYLAIALSGFTALAAQVVWTRLLALIFGATVYTFALILAAFLIGLGAGSGVGAALARSPRVAPRVALGWCQLLLGVAVVWAAYLLATMPFWLDLPPAGNPWPIFRQDLGRALLVVVPGAVLWGASFPLALASVAAPGQDAGRLVGGLYAANTVGAIAGALGTSLLLVPALGSQRAQQALIVIAGVSGLVALWSSSRAAGARAGRLGPSHPASRIARGARRFDGQALEPSNPRTRILDPSNLGTLEPSPSVRGAEAARLRSRTAEPSNPRTRTPGPSDPGTVEPSSSRLIHLAEFLGIAASIALAVRSVLPVPAPLIAHGRRTAQWAEVAQVADAGTILYAGEGRHEFVAVSRGPNGRQYYHAAGKVQASTVPEDMRLQLLLAHLSHLLPTRPATALVIGCGAGITAGALGLGPGVERITIAEIEPLVPMVAAAYFASYNHQIIHDPRVSLRIDDGRHVLSTTGETFDIITTDLIDPWVKGVATLFTREFFELARARLNPGGVVTQFVQLYQSSPEAVKSEIATFLEVFPDAMVWGNPHEGQGYDLVLVGQKTPTRIDVDRLQVRIDDPAYARVRESLRTIGITSAVDLVATYAGSGPDLTPWLGDAVVNRDRNLRLQYLAGLGLNLDENAAIYREMLQYARFPDGVFTGSAGTIDALRDALAERWRGVTSAADVQHPELPRRFGDRQHQPIAGDRDAHRGNVVGRDHEPRAVE
jgi:spermidine synthase